MCFFSYCCTEENRRKKCIVIINKLLECGVVKDQNDRIFLLQNIELWIDDYVTNNNVVNYIYALFRSEIQNKKINEKDARYINNILISNFNQTALIDENGMELTKIPSSKSIQQ